MEKGTSFCEECNKIVKYNSEDRMLTKRIHGFECEFLGKIALCPECGNELYVSEFEDYNLEELKKSYRQNDRILTIEEMKEMLTRYNIGKRPFSNVIGLGEITFTNYLDGKIPSRSNADLLNHVYYNPKFYKELLERNKDKISLLAYQKSSKAIENYLQSFQINEIADSKLKLLAAYIVSQCEDITQLMLQKMLYYVQSLYWLYYKKFIFDEDCEAWIHGPVYRIIYDLYKDYHYDSLEESYVLKPELTTDAKSIADIVIKYFGCYSGRILEKITHIETPWLKTREGLKEDERSDRIIDKNLLIEYFSENIGTDTNRFIINVQSYAKRQFEIVTN